MILDNRRFVPSANAAPSEQLDHLASQLRGKKVMVLSGAGLSTESGIPDYRGEGTRRRARKGVGT